MRTRSRAAPIYNELLPGWRARARDLTSSYSRLSLSPDATLRRGVGSSATRKCPLPSADEEILVDMDPHSVLAEKMYSRVFHVENHGFASFPNRKSWPQIQIKEGSLFL